MIIGTQYERSDVIPVKYESTKQFYPDDDDHVILKKAGNTSQIKIIRGPPPQNRIKKINKNEYVVISTGEVRTYQNDSQQSRIDNVQSLKRTMALARDVINANCTDIDKCLFLTLTYRQRNNADEEPKPMTDIKRLYHDLDIFYKRFRKKYGNKTKADKGLRRITACEPQGSGSWHAHIIYIFDSKRPYIPADELEELWGNGFVKIEKMRGSIDNIGAYLVSYLTDISTDDLKEKIGSYVEPLNTESKTDTDGKQKRIIKGMRLYLYPPFFRPFRFSRNCVKPEIIKNLTYDNAKEMIDDESLTFSYTTHITDDENNLDALIQTEYYKKI